jgi:hypothetical protein
MLVGLSAHAGRAASVLDFDRWMQRIEKRSLSAQKNLQRADGEAAAADAREIEVLYRLMEDYFVESGGAGSALELTRTGVKGSADIAARALAKDFDGARDTIRSMMRDCRTCHREYKPLT